MDVPLNDKNNTTLHTISCGSDDNPALVLIHGYGGGAVLFYKVFKELSKHFKVYAFDLPGMGSSTRFPDMRPFDD